MRVRSYQNLMKAVQGCQKLSKGHGDDDVVVEARALQVILGISRPFLPTTEGKSSQSDDYEYDQHDLSLSMHFLCWHLHFMHVQVGK